MAEKIIGIGANIRGENSDRPTRIVITRYTSLGIDGALHRTEILNDQGVWEERPQAFPYEDRDGFVIRNWHETVVAEDEEPDMSGEADDQ